MNRTVLAILAIGVIALVGIAGMVYWSMVNAPEEPPSGSGQLVTIGFRVENSTDGNWIINVTMGGSQPMANVRMTIHNVSTGLKTLDKRLNAIVPEKNDPDAVFYDNNANKRIDPGDGLLLKSSSPNIKPGYKVLFIVGDDVIGSIKELP